MSQPYAHRTEIERLDQRPGSTSGSDRAWMLGEALGEQVPSGAISAVMAELAERRPPFAAGRCRCGASGLMYVLGR